MVGLALALGTMSMAYIFQRDWSVRLTRVQEEQAARRRLLLDARDSLRIEIARLAGFERLKELTGPKRATTPEACAPSADLPPTAPAGSER
jgi:hypothetical protein